LKFAVTGRENILEHKQRRLNGQLAWLFEIYV